MRKMERRIEIIGEKSEKTKFDNVLIVFLQRKWNSINSVWPDYNLIEVDFITNYLMPMGMPHRYFHNAN